MVYHIYSKHNCQYCTKAKSLLTSRGLEFREMILGEDFTKEELLSWFPSARTFPQIEVYNDEGTRTYIGGFTELHESFK